MWVDATVLVEMEEITFKNVYLTSVGCYWLSTSHELRENLAYGFYIWSISSSLHIKK